MADSASASPLKRRLHSLAEWLDKDPKRARRVQVAAALLAFQGTAFVLVANKLVVVHPAFVFVGFAMIAAGGLLLLARDLDAYLSGEPAERKRRENKKVAATLAQKLIDRVTLDGRLDRWFPVIGAAMIVFDLAYNVFLSQTPELLSTDVVVLGLAAVLIAFPFVPARFDRERNFTLLFFATLTLIFGVPLLILRAGHDPYANVDEYTAALLAPQLTWLVNLFGMGATYSGNVLYYFDQTNGSLSSVFIATSCSGLYSMGIFIAAFSALVLSEYPRLTKRVGTLLVLGILMAYLANLLRMAIIVEVGYHYGGPALIWTHANLGDLIFLLWVAPFMWMSYRLLDPSAAKAQPVRADGFEEALREQGIDPATVSEKDWFCASCFLKVDTPNEPSPDDLCPRCGASLA